MSYNMPTKRPPIHPGEMLLEEFLVPMAMAQADCADRLGISRVRLNEIVKGKRGMTPDTALRLERLFGVSAGFWLNLQQAFDLYEAMHSHAAKEIKKIKPAIVT